MSIQPQDATDDEQPGVRTHSCDLETTPIRHVRRLVRDLLGDHPGVLLDDAVLVTDELVSNAIQHGRGPRSCRLTLIRDGRGLRAEVTDSGPGEPRPRTPDDTGGRGLLLVARLANAWGVHWFGDHKTVWAELVPDTREHKRRASHLSVAPDGSRLV
ncbi:ATP-binding protein [Actinophytocola glycyrrhizae]|uniref:ATP-binding protein n=1 Tax=Actinophytocola glycyrrhizae TaxID=2044873 RepID=A0ABV9RTG5_9PSEU